MAGFLPPPGFYLRYDFYRYEGTTTLLPLSGLVEANVRLRFIINLLNGTVVTPWKILGANYAAGITWGPVCNVFLKSQVEIGNRLEAVRQGDHTDFGEIILLPILLGWQLDQLHITFVGTVYAPLAPIIATALSTPA